MASSICISISVDRLQLVARIADVIEGIAPGVSVTTRPCEAAPGSGSSVRYRSVGQAEEAGEGFVLRVEANGRDVLADVEGVLGQFAGRHPLSLRYRLLAEW